MKTYILPKQAPRENCALEKALLTSGESFLLLTTVSPGVFIGTNVGYNAYVPGNEYGVPVTRYNGNGGPVYFDDGNIKTSFLINDNPRAFEICTAWVIRALNELGVDAQNVQGTNDITLNGKKIAGIGNVVIGNKRFMPFFITLNLNFDIASNVMVLTKHTDDIRERSVGINQVLETPITAEQVFAKLEEFYSHYWDEPIEIESELPEDIKTDATNNLALFNSESWLLYGEDE